METTPSIGRADETIDDRETEDWPAQVLELTDSLGILTRTLQFLRYGGSIFLMGALPAWPTRSPPA